MPVFLLTEEIAFPPSHLAEPDGLLAVGGDLTPKRLLKAYEEGIFPWYSDGSPPLWWSPNPRLVLFPEELRVSKSLWRIIKKGFFHITVDRAFLDVIQGCAYTPRKESEETWILPEIIEAYFRLHQMGYAHSVEAWCNGELAGGLYGVALGRAFYGESMFSRKTDASKVALVHLVKFLEKLGFELIDCQVDTSHLRRFGAREIPRSEFMERLDAALKKPAPQGPWQSLFESLNPI